MKLLESVCVAGVGLPLKPGVAGVGQLSLRT